jgi:PEP-CTERM motif
MHMRTKLKELLIFAVCANLSAIGVSSVRADLLDNAPSTGDDTLFQGGTTNSLGDPGIFVGTDSNSSFKYGLMAFNVSAIPAGATITGVTLDLYIGMVAGSGGGMVVNSGTPRTISLYDESQAWGASTNEVGSTSFGGHGQGFAANPGDATWLDASFNSNSSLATAWSSGMPANITSSSSALATTSGIPGTTSAEVQWSSTALATEVQGWVNNPTTNNGLVLVNSNSGSAQSFLAFWGAQGAANAANGFAPDLAITYSVPEPTTFALLGIAGAGLLLRRQRRALS